MTNKKLCIVVPYRDRAEHLEKFLPHINKTLKDQNIDFHVAIIEQEDGTPFNRAKLLNIGVKQFFDYDYFIFHDVDMLAINSDYSYCPNPTHLAAEAEQFDYKLPYETYFGGVTLFDKESFKKINGFSNQYWGYGGEDDDLYLRCIAMGIKISRKPCRFQSLAHDRHIDPTLYQGILERLHSFSDYVKDGKIIEGFDSLEFTILEESEIFENTTKIKVSI
jgi:predicted glycosyltransferase involved in capsule biosynthesis